MYNNIKVAKAVRIAMMFGAGAAATISVPAFSAEDAESVKSVERIEVTGSRIKRIGFESTQPITVVTAEEMNNLGYTNVADALNNMPAFGTPGSDQQGDQGGQNVGANYANFYGLGSQRTLVLVNGRRFVSGNPASGGNGAAGLQVDLNMIPLSMVDRVEVISIGGAPIYGSDAISGTVNVIMKKDFSGFEFDASYGVSSENDLKEKRFSMTAGGNFDGGKGNATFSIEYSTKAGAIATSRDHLAQGYQFREVICDDGDTACSQYARQLISNGTANIVSPDGVITGDSSLSLPALGLGALNDGNFYQFAPNGSIRQFDTGTPLDNAVWSEGGDGLFLPDVQNLSAPIDRLLVFSNFNYELSDNMRAYGEFFYGNTDATELQNQSHYQSGLFGQDSSAVLMNVNNPYLRDDTRAQLATLGVDDTFYLQRESRDLVVEGNGSNNTGSTWRMVTGMEGEFELADREFSWDVYYNYGAAQSLSKGGALNRDRFFYALDAVVGTDGGIECRVTNDEDARPESPADKFGSSLPTDIYDNCEPLNLFGNGAPSDAALGYINGTAFSESVTSQEVYGATIATQLFEMPAGYLDIAAGAFRRTETSAYRTDLADTHNLIRGGGGTDIAGEFTVDEFYVELFAPLVNESMDVPFVHKLSAEGAFRTMDNSFAGKDNAWTVGMNYAPIEDVELRGNVTRSVRSPAITELFSPVSRSTSFASDPCDGKNNSSDDIAQANRIANCAAEGIDRSTFVSNVGNASVQGVSGGNQELESEVADSYSVGLLLSPRWVEGLNIAIDYVNIEIESSIEVFSLTDLMQGCYDATDFPNGLCDTFKRGPDNQILKNDAYKSGYVNAGTTVFNALSIDVDYGVSLESYGDLRLGAYFFLPSTYEVTQLGTTNDDLGEPGMAELQATFVIDWNVGDFGLTMNPRYTGEVKMNNNHFRSYVPADENGEGEQKISNNILDLDAEWYLDLGARYQVSEKVLLRATISNLFDNTSSPASVASGDAALYSNIGRYMTVGVNVKF
ncbi:MAG: iron complex outermembrane receptor protein [Psychroserpens sp.]|jgi:iron complex outermembrane receptor protein